MFVLASGRHICVTQRDINIASPYKALQIWVKPFPNISHMKLRTDLILGEDFCIFIFFHFLDSGLPVLNSLHFYF